MHFIIYTYDGANHALEWRQPLPDPMSFPEAYGLPPDAFLVCIVSGASLLYIINPLESDPCPTTTNSTVGSGPILQQENFTGNDQNEV